MVGSIITSDDGTGILTSDSGDILVTDLPITVTQVNYYFQFATEYQARSDPSVGPYFNSRNRNMLLGLWVYDLIITKQPIPGFWFLIMQSVIDGKINLTSESGLHLKSESGLNLVSTAPLLSASPNLKLAFWFPGPLLVVNNLPFGVGNNFEIIFPGCATAVVNDWSKFTLR